MEFKVVRNNELYHHGIKGQVWGVRNGPPYPLESSQRSSKEKKDEKKKFSLTDKQKKALAIIAAGSLAVIGGVVLAKSGALDKVINIGKDAINEDKMRFTLDIQMFARKTSIKDFMEDLKTFENYTNEELFEVIGRFDRIENYDAVLSEAISNATKEELASDFFVRPVGDYNYLLINHLDGNYDIIWREQIEGTLEGLTERVFKNDKQ